MGQLGEEANGWLYNRLPRNSPAVVKLPNIPLHTRNGQGIVVSLKFPSTPVHTRDGQGILVSLKFPSTAVHTRDGQGIVVPLVVSVCISLLLMMSLILCACLPFVYLF